MLRAQIGQQTSPRISSTFERKSQLSLRAKYRTLEPTLRVELKKILLDLVKPQLMVIDLPKAAFLQYSNRSVVPSGDVRIEWPRRLLAQELRQRGRSDATPPVFSPYPIADEASAIGVPAANVSCYAIVNNNGSLPSGRIADDLRAPVHHEGVVLTWRKCRHTVSFGVTLMLEKDWQILFRHVPQHWCFPASNSVPQVQQVERGFGLAPGACRHLKRMLA
jgi:hypothetical protein